MNTLEISILIAIILFSFLWFIVRPVSVLTSGLLQKKNKKEEVLLFCDGVSVIVPCHNESKTIEKAVISILKSDINFPMEIILIENNSTDNTYEVIKNLSQKYPQVVSLSVPTPSSFNPISYSLNQGIEHCRYNYVVRLDADTEIASDSIRKALTPIINGAAVTTATNVRISNVDDNLLTKLQTLDYYFAMEMDRRSQRLYNSVLCCSGAMQVFKLSDLKDIGGYNNSKNIGEDMDITIRLHAKGKVEMTPEAIAYTDAPNTLKSLAHQRAWWMRIGIVTSYMHKKKIGKKYGKRGMLGLVALPIKVINTFQSFIGIGIVTISAFILSDTNVFIDFVEQFLLLSLLYTILNLFTLFVVSPIAFHRQGLKQWYLIPVYSFVYQPFLLVVRMVGVIQGLGLIMKSRKSSLVSVSTKVERAS